MGRCVLVPGGLVAAFLFACGSDPATRTGPDSPTPVAVEPGIVTLVAGSQQDFVALGPAGDPVEVLWAVLEPAGGLIDAGGRYTAPDEPGRFTVVATTFSPPTTRATARVVVQAREPVPPTVALEPAIGRVSLHGSLQFRATVTGTADPTVLWSVREADGGTVDATGRYTAPEKTGAFHVRATSRGDPRGWAEAGVEVIEGVAVSVSPSSAALRIGERLQFTASVSGTEDRAVIWSVEEASGGTIATDGTYTAPAGTGTFHVVATSVADPTRAGLAVVTVHPPVEVRVEPAVAEVEVGQARAFVAVVSGTGDPRVTWAVVESDGGVVDAGGRYTAPALPGTFHLTATSLADPSRSGTAVVTARPPVEVRVEPEVAALDFGERRTFSAVVTGTADGRVGWSVLEPEGGLVDATGTYVAPATAGTFHVVATSLADPNRSGAAEVTVRRPVEVRLEPAVALLAPGEEQAFVPVVTGTGDGRVLWSVIEPGGGTVDDTGRYTAPADPGTFHLVAASVADPAKIGTATIVVADLPPHLHILPPDRRDTWSPGLPGGIPQARQLFATLSSLPADGTGDAAPVINQAIRGAGAAYLATGQLQEVVLPAGTFRLASTVVIDRSGVVLRGQGPAHTRLRYDGPDDAVRIARAAFGTFTAAHGPWALARDGTKGTRELVLANADAAHVEVGDVLCVDEEDDPSFVRLGDAIYLKRQPTADTHGPPLRGPGLWRSVTSLIRVTGKTIGASETTLALADPLHMSFRTARYAQVFHVATEHDESRPDFEGVHHAGLEDFYVTGGPVYTNNVAFCWIEGLEVDGNPGTPNVGTYFYEGGISGNSVDLFHAYRCEVRGNYIHHSRNIAQGGGAYLLSLSSYTSESLIEDNVVVFGNKPIVGNMMGGGNVIAYNYVDNARTDHELWQEAAIDLNHQAFTHSALVEGNWATNLSSDTTHGNAGWHVFHRNLGTGQNSAPLFGAYPYTSGHPDGAYRRAAGTDGFHREATYVGNVLRHGGGTAVLQVDHTNGPAMLEAAVWRIGWGVDGDGGTADDGTALRLLHRHGNWDPVTGGIGWEPSNPRRTIPASLFRTTRPAFFGAADWPWIDPTGPTEADRVKLLPAKARYDLLAGAGSAPPVPADTGP